jgi:hypothetical protein
MKDQIPEFTRLAFQYGPFFFAVLFSVFVTLTARRAYVKATGPKVNVHRLVYLTTFYLGIALILGSVIWWFFHQPSYHIYRGSIKNLNDYEKIISPSLYFKPILLPKIDEDTPQFREEHFVIIQSNPFIRDQEFSIYYSKSPGVVEELSLEYISEEMPEFRIEYDRDKKKNQLVCPMKQTKLSSPLSGILHAEEIRIESVNENSISENNQEEININIINQLQDERTLVGDKIATLDMLNNLDDELLFEQIKINTDKEPMIITFLDLSRHSDPELADKAREIINNRFNIDNYLSIQLQSENIDTRNTAESILYRIEQNRTRRIINDIIIDGHQEWILDLKDIIDSGEKTRVLKPTGSLQGDRYYVKAKWNPDDKDIVNCLTDLFHSVLIHNRTLDEEKEIMKNRSERYVYWYSKQWALRIAQEIKDCRAEATFVNF